MIYVIKSMIILSPGYISLCCIALAPSSLAFIGWLCGTVYINSVAMPVSKYGGGKFLGIWQCLALALDPTEKFQ